MSRIAAQSKTERLRQENRVLRVKLDEKELVLFLTEAQLFLAEGRNRILSEEITETTKLLHLAVEQCKMILQMRDRDELVEGFTRSYHLLHRN